MAVTLGLDHLVLIAADVETTLAWYSRHAGLPAEKVDEWRAGDAPFPSLRIDESTIIDVVPGDIGSSRGHLDHLCLVVSPDDLAGLTADTDLEIVDQGPRSGARGIGQSIYVHDPDGLLVEFRSYPS